MKETMLLSMGDVFFVSFPISNAQADPDKSEDRRGSWFNEPPWPPATTKPVSS
ncbi:MAG: hypothetical protein J7K02_06055 [Deltaproteobacteria bacterium]|nr:hypothetical protein [Deltaproteobacteria bacterium]